jgi:hypothetical protein
VRVCMTICASTRVMASAGMQVATSPQRLALTPQSGLAFDGLTHLVHMSCSSYAALPRCLHQWQHNVDVAFSVQSQLAGAGRLATQVSFTNHLISDLRMHSECFQIISSVMNYSMPRLCPPRAASCWLPCRLQRFTRRPVTYLTRPPCRPQWPKPPSLKCAGHELASTTRSAQAPPRAARLGLAPS